MHTFGYGAQIKLRMSILFQFPSYTSISGVAVDERTSTWENRGVAKDLTCANWVMGGEICIGNDLCELAFYRQVCVQSCQIGGANGHSRKKESQFSSF